MYIKELCAWCEENYPEIHIENKNTNIELYVNDYQRS
jgi:hypothetical protein